MKANELRIGNLVKRNGLVVTCDHMSAANCTAVPEQYEPIPLTEGWLVKFGFEKQMAWTYRIHLFGDKWLVIYLGQKGWSIGNKNYPDFTNIHYVHQLQNLYFALTGEELEIVNP